MKKIVTVLFGLALLVGLTATPAQAHTIICELTVYSPAPLAGIPPGIPDKIVYGVKHDCSDNPDQMFVEAQAMIRGGSGVYNEYGSPMTYQCGYGGRPACKRTYTTFDWTYCSGAHHYKTRGLVESFHHVWGGVGPLYVPKVGGRWIDCADVGPLDADQQATIDAYLASL